MVLYIPGDTYMEKKELLNEFSHILEMNQKKIVVSPESNILLDKDLTKMRDYFAKIKLDEFVESSKEDKDKVIKYNKEFFKENLPLQKILVFDKDDIPYKSSPFKIIKFRKKVKTSYVDYSKILSGKHRGKIGFDEIVMKDDSSKTMYGKLAHELVHTQVEKNPNSLENFYNREVLSIFIELVVSRDISKENLDNMFRTRFKNVYECIVDLSYVGEYVYTFDKLTQFRCYLSSALKALHLYDIYNNSNYLKKREMLGLVEDVFRNKLTVESFLRIVDVDYRNSKDVELVKQYVKKYK